MATLSELQVRRRYLALLSLRWFATGLVIPIQVLLPLSRGLSLAQVGLVFSAQGFVVLLLELPTGALTDSWGRRQVLLLAGAVGLVASGLFYFAQTPAAFAVAAGLTGVFRALDSGPLEAWYVDATTAISPGYPIERGLSAGNAALSLALGAGALLSGGLVQWISLPGVDRLALPVLIGIVVQLLVLPITAALMPEVRSAAGATGLWAGVRGAPRVIGEGISLLRGSRVLLAIVSVELFWGFGMPAFESLTPVRLSEMLSDSDAAAALMGPVSSVAWGVSAIGSASALLLVRWWGVAASALMLRIVQGITVVVMGLVAGPVGLITAFLACYLVHGASNALHSTLLHRQVESAQRATVLSMNSMLSQGAGAVGTLVLPAIADGTSVQVSLIIAGVVIALAAPLYLPVWRADRALAVESAPLGTESVVADPPGVGSLGADSLGAEFLGADAAPLVAVEVRGPLPVQEQPTDSADAPATR